MLDCVILGDSIAVGTHQFKQECQLIGKSGINSYQFNKTVNKSFSSNVVVISLGSNDNIGIKTKLELTNLRSRISTNSKVYWILPSIKPDIQNIINEIAQHNGDIVLIATKLNKDGIHPSWASYKELADNIK